MLQLLIISENIDKNSSSKKRINVNKGNNVRESSYDNRNKTFENKKNNSDIDSNININMNDFKDNDKDDEIKENISNDEKTFKESVNQKLKEDFDTIMKKENIYNKKEKYDKYKEIFTKFLDSPFLSNMSDEEKKDIKITFIMY